MRERKYRALERAPGVLAILLGIAPPVGAPPPVELAPILSPLAEPAPTPASPPGTSLGEKTAEGPTPARVAASEENAFPVTLGSFSTTLIGSLSARTVNVRLAAEALDGQVIGPGEVLSFNRVVGPRTRERGFQPAPVILRETRQIQIGGGVCQVASTVFVAALLSGFSVEERHRHSTPIDYAPLGQDATIAWGVKDLKLRNDLAQGVRLRVELVGSAMTARFEGEEPLGESFEIATDEREILGDPGVGSMPGREIEVFRIRRSESGASSRDLLYRDVYPPSRSGSR